jgi:hypothetical protein
VEGFGNKDGHYSPGDGIGDKISHSQLIARLYAERWIFLHKSQRWEAPAAAALLVNEPKTEACTGPFFINGQNLYFHMP